MPELTELNILFAAGFGPIVKDSASVAFYKDTLGLPIEPQPGAEGYYHTERIDGVRHFALWPLSQAAQSCFGANAWPAHTREPHSWLEFDVEDVAAASAALKAKGCTLLVDNRKEPWGQIVSRLMSPEGVLIGITFTPWMRGG